MMIYKITITKAHMASCELGTGYSLRPWGSNTADYEGDDDGGRDYVLPKGYSEGDDQSGAPHIYDPAGQVCDICRHSSGRPQLVSAARAMPVLTATTIREVYPDEGAYYTVTCPACGDRGNSSG